MNTMVRRWRPSLMLLAALALPACAPQQTGLSPALRSEIQALAQVLRERGVVPATPASQEPATTTPQPPPPPPAAVGPALPAPAQTPKASPAETATPPGTAAPGPQTPESPAAQTAAAPEKGKAPEAVGPPEGTAAPPEAPKAPPKPEEKPEPQVTLTAAGAPLGVVLEQLAEQAGWRLVFTPGVETTREVSAAFRQVPVSQALQAVLRPLGYRALMEAGVLTVAAEVTKTVALRFPHLRRAFTSKIGGETLGIGAAGGGGTGSTSDGTTSSTSSSGGGGTALSGTVQVTFDLEAVSLWEEIAQNLRVIFGCQGGQPGGGGTTTGGASTGATGGTAAGGTAAQTAGTTRCPEGWFILQRDVGLVTLTGRPDRVEEAEAALRRLDEALTRTVFLDITVLEVTLSDRNRYGIAWDQLISLGDTFGSQATLKVKKDLGTLASAIPSPFTLTLTSKSLTSVIAALREQGDVQTVSQPKLQVANGQTALLSVGTIVPFVANVQQAVTGTAGTVTVTPVIGQAQDGFVLALTPRVQEQEVVLHVSPVFNKITEFKPFSVAGFSFENPVIASKSLSTVARAASGEVVVLGGLIDRAKSRKREGIPLLSQIPVLGPLLFTSYDRDTQTKELVLLIRPVVGPPPPPEGLGFRHLKP